MKCPLFAVLFVFSAFSGVFSVDEETVKITLFYETLCPYCIKFVTEQLYPTTQKLSKYVKLDLVPYGHAKREKVNGKWRFTCQHGQEECYGNKIHACVLEQSKFKSQKSLMEVLNCLMQTSYSDQDISKCLERGKFNYGRLKRCMITTASDLSAKYGERTDSNNPSVSYVPMIMLNDYLNSTLEENATENLLDTTCKLFEKDVPENCNDIGDENVFRKYFD